MNTNVSRPWQGTFLGVISIIGLFFSGLGVLLLLAIIFGAGAFMSAADLPGVMGMMGQGIFALIFIIALLVLAVFMTIGIFKGQRWSPIAMAVFTAISILQIIFVQFSLFGLILNGFMGWLEYTCIMHPFYNQAHPSGSTPKA